MKLFFGMVTRKGLAPEVFDSMRAVGVIPHLNISNIPFHAQARNELVGKFLRSDAEYLVWVDDDHIVPKNFSEYLSMDFPVCAPVSASNMEGNIVSSLWNWTKESERMKPDGYLFEQALGDPNAPIFEVDVVSGSGYKVRRDIVAKLADRHGALYYDDWEDEWGNLRYGEDVYFFDQLRKHGGRVTVNSAVEVGHLQLVDLTKVY